MGATDLDFATYSATHNGAPFSEWLRACHSRRWTAMVEHPFVADLVAGRMPKEVFVRYLRYEHRFVRAAITIFGYALVKAPTLPDQSHLIDVLHALAHDQDGYFAAAFAELGVERLALSDHELPSAALALSEGMIAIAAHGAFEDVVTGMLAAEWAYHSWCEAASGKVEEPLAARWIALHVEADFAAQVAWLKQTIDDRGPNLTADRQAQLAAVFGRVLDLEIAFHHAPYAD